MATATLTATSEGDLLQWNISGASGGYHWKAVETDEWFKYLRYSSVATVTDLVHFTSLPANATKVTSVTVTFKGIRGGGAPDIDLTPVVKTGGTVYSGTPTTLYDTSGATWITGNYTWTTNPNTTSSWTVAEVNALQAGVSLTGDLWETQCTYIILSVVYSTARISPSDTLTRVNSITRTFFAGTNPTYEIELQTGGVNFTYLPPVVSGEPFTAVPQETE